MLESQKIVGIVKMDGQQPDRRLLEWLALKLPVAFENRALGNFDGLDGVIFMAESATKEKLQLACPVPSLLLPGGHGAKPTQREISFTSSKLLPSVFRSRKVPQEILSWGPLTPKDGEESMAMLDGQPVWTARVCQSKRHDISTVYLPHSEQGCLASDSFHPRNFVGALPLIDFLRRISGEDDWSAPPLRACFIFDDPNLHGSSYGWLDYKQLTQHAMEHNYHATFATVPLDGWYSSKKAAAFFNGKAPRLSLLIHGNNHAHEELSSFANETEAVGQLAQALRRIERVEAATGVRVGRVMVPPHGTCSEVGLQAMARLGFEAVCTTHSWLALRNPGKPWTRTLGLNPAEVVVGMPVLGRFRLDSLPRNSALLAAYLGQPILLYGHHGDVAGGISALDDLADFVNSIGSVQWAELECISRQNYKTRRRNGLLEIRSYSRVLELAVPQGVKTLCVNRCWLQGNQTEALRITSGQGIQVIDKYAGEPIPVISGAKLHIQSILPNAIDPRSVRMPKLKVQDFVRKQLISARDRLQPARHFLQTRNHQASR